MTRRRWMRRNALPRNERQGQAREQALATLALMRRKGIPLRAAAKAERVDPEIVLRYAGSALLPTGRGDYRATPFDLIPRTLHVVTPQGTVPVTVYDSRTASQISQYMNAVRKYVRTGDSSALARFKGKVFLAAGVTYQFVTDPATLDRLADAGALSIEGLYRATE